MGTNFAPLVAVLSLFSYERDFMLSLSDNNQTDIIEAFNSTSRYLDDLLNIDSIENNLINNLINVSDHILVASLTLMALF